MTPRKPHECPPHRIDKSLEKLLATLRRVVSGNMADVPIAISFEGNTWYVDIHVKIPGVVDYEIGGVHESLDHAIANANRTLAHRTQNERRSHNDQATFGYTV